MNAALAKRQPRHGPHILAENDQESKSIFGFFKLFFSSQEPVD